MDLARYVVDAVVLEGRSYREVAQAHGVSKSWVGKVVGRFREGGYDAIEPRSRAPERIPHRTPDELEDEIVALRKELGDLGFDAGAQTIHYHLGIRHEQVPSVSTIWRVLRRRGFVTPQPHKRPRSSWVRFEAQLPNECWQSDVTHWRLAGDTEVEIVNVIDDHSRVAVGSRVLHLATAAKALEVFLEAGRRWGLPSALLTDNGCVYTTWHRGGPNVMQTELLALGIDFRHSRPYHPQTCGKVERFHQTMKAFLAKQPKAARGRGAAGAGRSLRRLLQRGAAPSGEGTHDAAVRLPGAGQGETVGTEDPDRGRRAGSQGPDRQEREGDASPQDAAPPHRHRPRTQGHARDPARRRVGRAGALRGRGAAATSHAGSDPRLPAPGLRRGVYDVPTHPSTMS